MNSLITKRKMFVIATGIFLVSMATTFLLLNENKINIDGSHLQANILSTSEISTVQDEATLRELVGINEDDFLIVKIDRTLRFVSSKILETHGFEEYELKDLNILTFIHPKDLPSLSNTLMVYHQEKVEKNNLGPLRIKTKSGSYIPYMVSLKPLKDKNDEIVETIVILKDVSTPLGEIEETQIFHQTGADDEIINQTKKH